MKKGTFIFYDIDLVSIQYLTDEQAGKLIKAISYSRIQGKEPDFSDDAALKILFYQISEHITMNEEKYKEKCKKNSESAKKRWEKEKSKTTEKQCDCIGSNTNECLYDTDTETDTYTDNDTYTDTDNDNDNDACGAKRESKRKNYYSKKNNLPVQPKDDASYDIEAFERKAIGLKYKKPEVTETKKDAFKTPW